MRVKEAKTCGAFAWSPKVENSGFMAVGSIAGAMDDDFSADAHLEIRSVDVWDTSSQEMPIVARTPMHDRVHRIDWSTHSGTRGIIAGGFVDGSVCVWSADKMMEAGVCESEPEGDANPLLCRINAHSGAARGCHFNTMDPHFLATGGADKEMKIYSLERPSDPQEVPACNKSTHASEITDLRWNPKFKHILGSTTSAGVVTVWDLKAKRAALSFNVSNQGVAAATANTLAWHPEIATIVAVARDEPNPVIQIWDLKKAMAPVREIQGHTKGVLALAWCAEDPSVLMSVGADGRTMCWNPLTGDQFGELPVQDNWVYDVKWAPHFPAVICTASFDSSISVFGAQDISGQSSGSRTAPKWLSRPCSASWGFGGRLSVAADKTGKTINIVKAPESDTSYSGKERTFCSEFAAHPINTNEGAEWLTAKGWGVIGAAAAARIAASKEPLMKFLGADPEAAQAKVEEVPKDPFNLPEEEFSKIVSECVVAGRLSAAIDLCLAASKFDDAFAVAYVAGDAQMKRVHAEFVAAKSGKQRFAKYVGAIASGNYEALAEDADNLPWKEVLSLYAAFAPSQTFAQVCNALGEVLAKKGNLEAAANCFVYGSNLDRVAAIWKESGKYDTQSLVQVITVLEQTLGRGCNSPVFADALAEYAEALAFEGEFQSSAHYAQRAASLGCESAAAVANRVQVHMGQRADIAFKVTPIPDATTMECQMMGSQQPQVSQPRQQQPAATQPNRPAGQPGPSAGQPATQPNRVQQQPMPANTGGAPNTYADPHRANVGAAQPRPGPSPAVAQQPPPSTGVTGGRTPSNTMTGPAPTAGYPTQPATAGYPNQSPTGQPPSQPYMHGGAKQPSPSPSPNPSQPTNTPPPTAQPPVNPGPAKVPSASSTPTTATPPVRASPVTAGPTSMPRASSGPAAGKETVADVDTSAVPEQYRSIVAVITGRVEKITEKRKRDTVEKAAVTLFQKLNAGQVSNEVAEGLVNYANALGTPQGKEIWRQLGEKHWDALQPFFNIKFLA